MTLDNDFANGSEEQKIRLSKRDADDFMTVDNNLGYGSESRTKELKRVADAIVTFDNDQGQ